VHNLHLRKRSCEQFYRDSQYEIKQHIILSHKLPTKIRILHDWEKQPLKVCGVFVCLLFTPLMTVTTNNVNNHIESAIPKVSS